MSNAKVTRPKAPHIDAISIENYKAFSKLTKLELGDLTVLTGTNSSGKSSIMEPLLLLRQTLDSTTDPGALDIDGPDVSVTSFGEQVLSRLNKHRDNFEVNLSLDANATIGVQFAAKRHRGVELRQMVVTEGDARISLREGMTHEEIYAHLFPPQLTFLNTMQGMEGPYKDARLEVSRDRCFLQIALVLTNGTRLPFYPFGLGPGAFLQQDIRGLVHVPASRYNLERLRAIGKATNYFPGEFDDYTASMVYRWQLDKAGELRRTIDDLKRLGIAEKLRAFPLSDVEVSLSVNRSPGQDDMIELTEVGLGVSQVLPVVVALQAVADKRIVYIEEPESHLHPNAQYALADVFARAIKRGVRIIIETHSSLLLLGLQEIVAKGEIDASKTRLHWFEQDRTDGRATVSTVQMSPSGTFEGWPNDFAAVALDVQRKFLSAFEKRELSSIR